MVIPDGLVTLKWRFSFFETLRSIESSSSGVALAAGEMPAPALAEATAVAETDGAGDWPNAVQTSAIEQRQAKIAVFIVVLLGVRCRSGPVWIQKKDASLSRSGADKNLASGRWLA